MAKSASGDTEEKLTVAAVARRIGVAPATLRTWDRRYGLGPSTHEAGEHRRYCPEDLSKLMLMRRLISAGVSPSDAAEQATVAAAAAAPVAAGIRRWPRWRNAAARPGLPRLPYPRQNLRHTHQTLG